MKERSKLTAEQDFRLRMFYAAKQEKRRKQNRKDLKDIWNGLKSLGDWVTKVIALLVSIFVASVFGIGVKPIILLLNYPLGIGYATFASYAVSGLVMYLLIRGQVDR